MVLDYLLIAIGQLAKGTFFTLIGPKAFLSGVFTPEAESKEKHGVWDPVPELTIISPYVDPESSQS